MRDIKFRGLTIGENSHWVIGYLCKKFEDDVRIYAPKMQVWSSVRPETVCEYTGLKSKGGYEIFEGDVLSDGYESYTVYWTPGGFWARGNTMSEPLEEINEDSEIVGNIFRED
jgi:hypothetical protein